MNNKSFKRTVSFFTTAAVMAAMLGMSTAASAAGSCAISYNFTGTNAFRCRLCRGNYYFYK